MGVLYRSDSPHVASDADVRALIGEFGITDVVDLRSQRELDADGRHPGFADAVRVHHFPIAGGPGNAIEAAPSGERLAARYLEYLEMHVDSVVGTVASIATMTEGATVVHCRIGKDRTGVVIGLILDAVGVRADEIARDFARTTLAMKGILADLRTSPTYSANVSRLPDEMYRSDAATMTVFLTKLRELHGGAARWLTDHGLSVKDLDKLSDRLVCRKPLVREST